MSTIIGYARVSTTAQDPALQVDALQTAGAARVFVDVATGAHADRPELAATMDYLRRGDTLAVWRLDRFGRSLRDLIDQVNRLDQAGIGFMSLTEGIDTSTPSGRLVFHIFGAIGQFERELIRERTVAGLQAARARGRNGGRPSLITPQLIGAVNALRNDGQTLSEISTTLKVSRSTVSRALRQGGAAP